MAVVIAAPASGSGKTLVSLTLLSWARQKGLSIQPFKVGPDYLDPQLLSSISDRPCRNLDPSLCGSDWVQRAYQGYGGEAELALVEGVMGLFDGIGSSEKGSTAAVARLLDLPVVLVVDAGGQAASLGALVQGFRDHDKSLNLAGVVLNRVSSDRHRELLTEVLARQNIPLLGCLPRTDALTLASRHLGLAPAHELEQRHRRREVWASLAERHLNLDRLQPLLQAPASACSPLSLIRASTAASLPVAVARDDAFHFRYRETEELLEHLGMPMLNWSPMDDEPIPAKAKGLILPGGFPELHAARLSQARRSLSSLGTFVKQHPVYAECGGMLLLGQELTDPEGIAHPMASVLPFSARSSTLQVGYRQLTPKRDGLLVRRNQTLTGHEFHRWELQTNRPATDGSVLWDIKGWKVNPRSEGWGDQTLHASWVHLHWASCSTICCRWRDALEAAAMRSPTVSSQGRSP